MNPNQLCGAIHQSTGATCEKPVEHLENHCGPFLHGTVQWPKEDSPRKPTEDEINQLEKAAWDAGVDQALVYLRDERDLAQAELRSVDMVLAGRSAFDAVKGRINKILAAINAASVADPKAESVRAITLQAERDEANANVATLTARCEALTAKQKELESAFSTLAELAATSAKDRDKAESRYQHLEQAMRDYRAVIVKYQAGTKPNGTGPYSRGEIAGVQGTLAVVLSELDAALASLLPTKDKI